MNRRFRAVSFALLLFFSLLAATPWVSQEALAATYEENFDDCTLGSMPNDDWAVYGAANQQCSNGSGYGTTPSMYVSHYAPSTTRGAATESFTVADSDSYTVGFWFNVSDFSGTSSTDIRMSWIATRSNTSAGDGARAGVRVQRQTATLGDLYVFNSNAGSWSDTGYDINENEWYRIRLVIDDLNNQYDVILNSTTVATDVLMDGTATVSYLHTLITTGLGGGGGVTYTDWISVDAPILTALADESACRNAAYSRTAVSDAAGEVTWSMTGAPSELSISGSGVISGTPATSGQYTVAVTVLNSAGSDSDSYTLTVSDCGGGFTTGGTLGAYPASFERKEPILCAPDALTVTFEDTTIDPRLAVVYIWDFGDGSNIAMSPGPNVTHTFPTPGTYGVTQAVLARDGTVYRSETDVDVGFCKAGPAVFAPVLTMLIMMAATLWLTYVFTRRKMIRTAAIIVTFLASGVGYFYFAL